MPGRYDFSPERHEDQLAALIADIDRAEELDPVALHRILRRHPKNGSGFFSKSEIVRGFRHLRRARGWRREEAEFLQKIRMKPVRTLSGVAPVTVLTKPFQCPGGCIFCPSDVRMPKSYLSDEPGAQRAAQHRFDPYAQTLSRLRTYHRIGHRIDKVELIVLGGTWSSYPEAYQVWFVTRCLEAMNDFGRELGGEPLDYPEREVPDPRDNGARVDGRAVGEATYNRLVSEFHAEAQAGDERATWAELDRAQRRNETAAARCVGLVVETRPDHLSRDEVLRIRRLGATKVQIGIQSLSDEVLAANRRGHDVAATRRAFRLLREAGLKIHAHWMPNLYGSSPAADRDDYDRLFADPAIRPDELKIYPCSLIESAELMAYWEAGRWRPYEEGELTDLLVHCLATTPDYCRLTRIIRDIPGTDIVAGSRVTNLRQHAESELARRGLASRDIRAREVRGREVEAGELRCKEISYSTSLGDERFLQFVTPDGLLAGFLRLSLPAAPVPIPEIAASAMIREVHVYGRLVGLGERVPGRSQHRGLGSRLVERAAAIASEAGFDDLAVISAIGTRDYYRGLGFADGELYQHRPTAAADRPRQANSPSPARRASRKPASPASVTRT